MFNTQISDFLRNPQITNFSQVNPVLMKIRLDHFDIDPPQLCHFFQDVSAAEIRCPERPGPCGVHLQRCAALAHLARHLWAAGGASGRSEPRTSGFFAWEKGWEGQGKHRKPGRSSVSERITRRCNNDSFLGQGDC